MRADGITVGEAMDRDAAFLRSIGHPAKDGRRTYDERIEAQEEKRQEFIYAFGHKVLDAMDEIVDGNGWLDKDLSDLLPAIHKHAGKIYDRTPKKTCIDCGIEFIGEDYFGACKDCPTPSEILNVS